MFFSFQLMCAYLLDLVVGDPERFPHPVKGIGWCCTVFENRARKVYTYERLAGLAAMVAVLVVTLLAIGLPLLILHTISPFLEGVAAIVLLATAIASRSLYDHSMRVYRLLTEDAPLDDIRREVGRIVGRDTGQLDRQGLLRASVETVAESLVDGITAPLFWAVVMSLLDGGDALTQISMAVLGAYLYKAINTMDSMYGYKNSRYIDFGHYPARLDDLVNFLPARLSSLVMVVAGWLLRLDAKQGWRILVRDRFNHASPNSGHGEAVVAGLLGIQLGGASSYFGTKVDKPTIGDSTRLLTQEDIVVVNRLMFGGGALFLVVLLFIRAFFLGS